MSAVIEREADLFPIGSRVKIRDTGQYGTVSSWGFVFGMIYSITTDCGARLVAPGTCLERARPHRQWFLEAIVLERRA